MHTPLVACCYYILSLVLWVPTVDSAIQYAASSMLSYESHMHVFLLTVLINRPIKALQDVLIHASVLTYVVLSLFWRRSITAALLLLPFLEQLFGPKPQSTNRYIIPIAVIAALPTGVHLSKRTVDSHSILRPHRSAMEPCSHDDRILLGQKVELDHGSYQHPQVVDRCIHCIFCRTCRFGCIACSAITISQPCP